MPSKALVWFKRDLRLRDHAPLAHAVLHDESVGLYIIEPEWISSQEFDAQHLEFVLQSLAELRAALAQRGLPLLVRVGSALNVLSQLRSEFAFTHVLSHEETGSGWTYTRDRAVAAWCKAHGVQWQQWPHTGVVRRLVTRAGWAGQWATRMNAIEIATPTGFPGSTFEMHDLPTLASLGVRQHARV